MGTHKQTTHFALDGCLQDYIYSKGKVKGLRLETSQGMLLIKLPKALRGAPHSLPQPGKQIQVWGERIINLKKARIKLVASAISPVGQLQGSSKHSNIKASKRELACIRVCQKGGCRKRGGKGVWERLIVAVQEAGLGDRIQLQQTNCMGKCKAGPNLKITPHNIRYQKVSPHQIPELLQHHFS